MILPRFLARRRTVRRFARRWERAEAKFAQESGADQPAAPAPGPLSAPRGSGSAATSVTRGRVPAGGPSPARPLAGASIAGPCVVCGGALSECDHGPIEPGAERFAWTGERRAQSGGWVPVRPIPPGRRVALGASGSVAHSPTRLVHGRPGAPNQRLTPKKQNALPLVARAVQRQGEPK